MEIIAMDAHSDLSGQRRRRRGSLFGSGGATVAVDRSPSRPRRGSIFGNKSSESSKTTRRRRGSMGLLFGNKEHHRREESESSTGDDVEEPPPRQERRGSIGGLLSKRRGSIGRRGSLGRRGSVGGGRRAMRRGSMGIFSNKQNHEDDLANQVIKAFKDFED